MAESRNRSALAKAGGKSKKTRFTVVRSASPGKKTPHEALLSKEEEYKRLNAELEAKTAELVREAEEVMREQQEIFSRPISSCVNLHDDQDEQLRAFFSSEVPIQTHSHVKNKDRPKSVIQNRPHSGIPNVTRPLTDKPLATSKGNKKAASQDSKAVDVAVPEDFGDFSLARTISKIEGKLEEGTMPDADDEDIIPGVCSGIGADQTF